MDTNEKLLVVIGFLLGVMVMVMIGTVLISNTADATCQNYATLSGIETRYEKAEVGCEFNVNGFWVPEQNYIDFLEGAEE